MSDSKSIIDFNRRKRVITYNPIVYNSDTDFSQITNVLLVDSNVQNYNKFVENCNSSTFPITFSSGSKGQDIVDLLATKLPSITRIAIVANDLLLSSGKRLLNYKPYFEDSDLIQTPSSYSENVQFLIDLIKTHKIKNIDYLACNTLTYEDWKGYYSVLTKETGVVVGASSDKTGNIQYGGDWVMESTGVDIEAFYFISGISSYQETLDPTVIDFNCKLYQGGWSTDDGIFKNEITWPCTLAKNITVTIAEPLTYNNISNYFTIDPTAANNVTLDGAGHTVTIDGVLDYQGLVLSRSNNTIVKNIGVLSSGNTTLANFGGWIGQGDGAAYYPFKGSISNCYSTGDTSGEESGGIVGSYAANCTITDCHSIGTISGIYSGGIAGSNAGSDNGICTIKNCHSKGIISNGSGGIVGFRTGGYGGNCTITNCYSIGTIRDGAFSGGSGGIAGINAGISAGVCTITNCYSTGAISVNSGGIVGRYAGENSGVCNISNCYSTGAISVNSGGIVGSDNSGVCTISNCYSTGGANSDDCGGIVGANSNSDCNITNCYTKGTFLSVNNHFQPASNSNATIDSNTTGHDDTWTNATANDYLDNISGCWKVFVDQEVPWNLVSFLTGVTATVDSTTITYTNNLFPINAYSGLNPVFTCMDDSTYMSLGYLNNNGKTLTFPKGLVDTTKLLKISVNVSGNTHYIDTFILDKVGTKTYNNPLLRDDIYNYKYTYPLNITGTTQVTINSNIIVGNFRLSVADGNTVTIGDSSNLRKITINNIPGYEGLVSSGSNNTTIQNIDIVGSGTTTFAVTGVTLTRRSATINTGTTTPLSYNIAPPSASNKGVTWTSSDPNVATVSVTGLVRAGNIPGTAIITVTTVDGSYIDTCTITVVQPVTGVTLTRTSDSINTGAEVTLVANIAPPNASNTGVTWSSSDITVATVDNNGLVTAGNIPGQATITVTTLDGIFTDTCIITVLQPVTGVTLNFTTKTINTGTSTTLLANVNPSDASNKNITWISNNTNLATVVANGSNAGLVTARNTPGQATITVTTVDGLFKANCIITVFQPVTGVKLNATTVTLNTKSKKQLLTTVAPPNASNKDIRWSSSNTKIATVTSSGLVTTLNVPGKVVIKATTVSGSRVDSCTITVIQSVTSVALNTKTATLKIKATRRLTATVNPTNVSNTAVKWTSSNPKVATVSSSGLVTAVNVGKATITVTTVDGSRKATSVITVVE